jgi:hypothetical protein
MSQNTLLYSDLATGNQYFNLCRDLSWMNSKNHEHSDRDGHVIGYICNVKVHGTVANSISLGGAPNSWKMRNSFRKWHAYRNLMFTEAGVTDSEKGRYGKTIRPYLDSSMKGGIIKDPVGWDISGTPPVQTQEWTYTQIAASPGFSALGTGTDGKEIVDVYDLNITGVNQVEHTATNGTEYFTSVGMIHSYNQDRQEQPLFDLADSSQFIAGQNNPLALLKQGGSVSGGEVMDIVEDQEREAPPYDITDSGFSTSLGIYDIMQINPGYDGTSSVPVLRTAQVFVPAGLLKINCTATDSGASILIDVVGTVLCKDMA